MSEKKIDFPAKLVFQPTQNFVEQVASKAPAPGGGSAAALSGAVGTALLSMVCTLTVGKKAYADVAQELQEVRARTETLRARLTALVDEDNAAFNRFRVSNRLPERDDAEKEAKVKEVAAATQETIDVPMTTMQTCLEALRDAPVVASKGNVNCVSDAGVGAAQLYTGLIGGSWNVLINLDGLEDTTKAKSLREKVWAAQKEGGELIKRAFQIVHEKLNGANTNPA